MKKVIVLGGIGGLIAFIICTLSIMLIEQIPYLFPGAKILTAIGSVIICSIVMHKKTNQFLNYWNSFLLTESIVVSQAICILLFWAILNDTFDFKDYLLKAFVYIIIFSVPNFILSIFLKSKELEKNDVLDA